MALDRDSIIGNKCEVDGCHSPCVDDETRCHDHSINRLLEEAFDASERCRFGGTQCVVHATRVNQYGVLMCENCYRQWTRITAANLHATSPYLMGEAPFVQGNQQSMGTFHHPLANNAMMMGHASGRCFGLSEPCYQTAQGLYNNNGQMIPLCSQCMTAARTRDAGVSPGSMFRSLLGIPRERREEGDENND